MKIDKVEISNYRNLESKSYKFSPYLNIVHSPNLSGKTTFFRAIENTLFFGTIKHNRDLTWGKDKSEDIKIKIVTTNYELERVVSKSEQVFYFNGEETIGLRDSQTVLQKEIGFKTYGFFKDLKNLNFFQARQSLLLSQNTPQELFKLFSTLYGINYFTEKLKVSRKELNQTNSSIKIAEEKENEVLQKLEALDHQKRSLQNSLKNYTDILDKLDGLYNEVSFLSDRLSSLQNLRVSLKNNLVVGGEISIKKDKIKSLGTYLQDLIFYSLIEQDKIIANENICPTCKRPL